VADSLTGILPVIDWNLLSPETRTVAQMIAEGYDQRSIATALGRSHCWVELEYASLRCELLRQAREHADELPPQVRARVLALPEKSPLKRRPRAL
jgi:hypothetical protein